VNPPAALREIRRFDPERPLEEATTPPASWYTEPAILALERERVFRRTWQLVARADQLERAGAYVAGSLLGLPYLIVRGQDGELRAFANVCAHHATVLLRGEGCVERITCPYHGWTYDLAGRLVRATGAGGMRGFEREAFGLRALQLRSSGALVFLAWDSDPSAFDPDGVLQTPDLWSSAAGPLRFVAQEIYTVRCNWKVVVDNYLDGGYHVAILHPELAASLDMEGYETHVLSRSVIQRVEAKAEACDRRLGERALYAWGHPTWMLNRYGAILDVNRVVPIDVTQTRVTFDFFMAPDRASDPELVRASLAASRRIQLEDGEICERVQEGLGSGAYDLGRYAPRFEAGAHRFHCLLARDLAG